MTATEISAPPGPAPRGGWVVTTDASAARAAAVTGTSGWRRPKPGERVRRSFATETDADVAATQLLRADHWADVAPRYPEPAPMDAMRIPRDLRRAADAALRDQQGPRDVTVTLAPGTSRSAAVRAFLAALGATQVSAEG
jgi:hypothetical protein